MTPATGQRQCTLPRGHDSLHWFYGLEVVQRSTPLVTGHSQKYWWQERPPEAIPPLTASWLEQRNDGIVPGKSWNGQEL